MWRDPRWRKPSCCQCSGLVTLTTWDKLLSGMWPVQSVIPLQQVLSHLINHAECCLLLRDCLVDVISSLVDVTGPFFLNCVNKLNTSNGKKNTYWNSTAFFFLNSEILNWFKLYFFLVCEPPPLSALVPQKLTNVCVSARLQHCGFSADIHCPLPCYEGWECETVLFLIQLGGKYILRSQNLHSLITVNNCKWEHHLTWRAWFEFWSTFCSCSGVCSYDVFTRDKPPVVNTVQQLSPTSDVLYSTKAPLILWLIRVGESTCVAAVIKCFRKWIPALCSLVMFVYGSKGGIGDSLYSNQGRSDWSMHCFCHTYCEKPPALRERCTSSTRTGGPCWLFWPFKQLHSMFLKWG